MKKSLIAIALITALLGCDSAQQTNTDVATTQTVQDSAAQAKMLQEIFEQAFIDFVELSPISGTYLGMTEYNDKFQAPISNESIAKSLQLEQFYLDKINTIDASQLSGQDLLSYEIFKRDRTLAIEGYQFNSQYIPLNQMYGVHNSFAGLGSGSSAQPFNTVEDYQNFFKRADGFALYMDSVITILQEGVSKGYSQPKAIIEKIIPQLSAHVVDDPADSIFYEPVNMLADNDNMSDEQKADLTEQYKSVITKVITPAYAKMLAYMESDYLDAGRSSVGLSALPNGENWYKHQIKVHTTLDLTAKEIHEFGKQEVARILSEMTKVKEQVNFEGDLHQFFDYLQNDDKFYWQSEEEVIAAYTNVRTKINERLPQLFEVFPKADYEVRAVEKYRAASSAGASYQSPPPDGSRPGVFYVNTHNLKAQPKFLLETLSIHEASPGHHFQIVIQQEVEGLPNFRKYGGYTVFAEGWALYAESLGKEFGMFTDPYQWYGRLSDEQLRAMRLVVDTGLHSFGWTREQAIEFMVDNSSMALSDITAEVERYISMPGQALAYKIGQRAIRDLRNKVEKQLGDKFDVRKFHTQILIDGSLPIPVLEKKIMRWAKTQ